MNDERTVLIKKLTQEEWLSEISWDEKYFSKFPDARNKDFSHGYFRNHNLGKADFSDSTLRKTNFNNTKGCVQFTNACACGATFIDANLANSVFRGADLQDANFSGANLQGADFIDANLQGVDFTGADLTGAIFKKEKCSLVSVILRFFGKQRT